MAFDSKYYEKIVLWSLITMDCLKYQTDCDMSKVGAGSQDCLFSFIVNSPISWLFVRSFTHGLEGVAPGLKLNNSSRRKFRKPGMTIL